MLDRGSTRLLTFKTPWPSSTGCKLVFLLDGLRLPLDLRSRIFHWLSMAKKTALACILREFPKEPVSGQIPTVCYKN